MSKYLIEEYLFVLGLMRESDNRADDEAADEYRVILDTLWWEMTEGQNKALDAPIEHLKSKGYFGNF